MTKGSVENSRRALVAGWFSFENGHATAGDILAREVVCRWLDEAGLAYDCAVAPPFGAGVDWRTGDPVGYSHVVFVCGPFQQGELEAAFLMRFAECRLIGLDLSMALPPTSWNPFDILIERDSTAEVNADIVFLAERRPVPIVGVCLVEAHPEARVEEANAAIERLLSRHEAAILRIDTRLDANETGLRSPAEVESLIARVDLLVTTRLHGLVLALKNGVPVLAVDAVPQGGKIVRQARKIGWPLVLTLEELDADRLEAALRFGLSPEARRRAQDCAFTSRELAQGVRRRFLTALAEERSWDQQYRLRTAPDRIRSFRADMAAAFARGQGDPDGSTLQSRHGFARRLLSRLRF